MFRFFTMSSLQSKAYTQRLILIKKKQNTFYVDEDNHKFSQDANNFTSDVM